MAAIWSYFFGNTTETPEPTSPLKEEGTKIYDLTGSFYSWKNNNWDCIFNDAVLYIVGHLSNHFLVISERNNSQSKSFRAKLSEELNIRMATGILDCPSFEWVFDNQFFMFELDAQLEEKASDCALQLASSCFFNQFGRNPSQSEYNSLVRYVKIPEVNSPTQEENIQIQGTSFFSENRGISWFELHSSTFKEKSSKVQILISSLGDSKKIFKYHFYILNNEGKAIFFQEINDEMFHSFSRSTFVWSGIKDRVQRMWSLQFSDSNVLETFKKHFVQTIYEVRAQEPFTKIDTDWVLSGYSENADMELDDEFDKMQFEDEEESASISDDEMETDPEWKKWNENAKNSLLNVAYMSDRAFVTRGSQVGVFKMDPQDRSLKYTTRIDKIRTPKENKFFSPSKSMLHQQDSKMLLLNNDDKKKIFELDMERGQVIEEWKVHDDYPVVELFPSTKFAQTQNTSILQGMNSLGVCTIDPRLPKNKMVESRSAFYSARSDPRLTCAATTDSGQLVVGSKKGDVRLFSANLFQQDRKSDPLAAPRAKTTLPGFGDPIIGVDVSSDGKWILATCKTYLLVIPTQTESHQSGFDVAMGKQKPPPRRLCLKPEDIKLVQHVSFTPAHFNVGGLEDSILTTTGEFVITWNFRKVKQNQLQHYVIRRYQSDVVEKNFMFKDSSKIIVATANSVSLAKKDRKG